MASRKPIWWLAFVGALASAVLMVVGSLGTWAEVLFLSVEGTDGDLHGSLIVGGAIAAGIAVGLSLVPQPTPRTVAPIVAAALGLACVGVVIYDAVEISSGDSLASRARNILGDRFEIAWGAYMAGLASATLTLASLLLVLLNRESPTAPASVPDRPTPASAPDRAAPEGEPRPASWYPDPHGRARLRWWDGAAWTDHTRD